MVIFNNLRKNMSIVYILKIKNLNVGKKNYTVAIPSLP